MIRDYAFTAMGAALMVLVAFLVTRVPIVNDNTRTWWRRVRDAGAEGVVDR